MIDRFNTRCFMLALIAAALAILAGREAAAEEPADFVQIRFAAKEPDHLTLQDILADFGKANPRVGFDLAETRQKSSKTLASDLLAGKLDALTVAGPVLEEDADWLLTLLEKEGCQPLILGWQVLAVAVHPDDPRKSITVAELQAEAAKGLTNWREALRRQQRGEAALPLRMFLDARIARAAAPLKIRASDSEALVQPLVPLYLEQLMKTPGALGLVCVDQALVDSRLKILPIAAAAESPAVLPTPQNVQAGKYPYFSYVLFATHPRASAATADFARELRAVHAAQKFPHQNHWIPRLLDPREKIGMGDVGAKAPEFDPAQEDRAFEQFLALQRASHGNYKTVHHLALTSEKFLEVFPNSKRNATVVQNAIFARLVMRSFLQSDFQRSQLGVPLNLDHAALAKECQRTALRHFTYFHGKFPGEQPTTSADYREEIERFYTFKPTAAEVEEVLAEYGKIFDDRPAERAHSDFLRLAYLARQSQRDEYVALLAKLQARWPDPQDVHWKLSSGACLSDLCELLQSDPRGTDFYWWLRGKRSLP